MEEELVNEYIGKYVYLTIGNRFDYCFIDKKIGECLKLILVNVISTVSWKEILTIRELTEKEIRMFKEKKGDSR